jgi:hypothetical protein
MPIYEYACECGATLESIESVGTTRTLCGELCKKSAGQSSQTGGPAPGEGRVERVLSATGIRGDGREAKEPIAGPPRRPPRPGCEDCDG